MITETLTKHAIGNIIKISLLMMNIHGIVMPRRQDVGGSRNLPPV
jgi:hypothetical protein